MDILNWFRMIFGATFVLFLPGFSWSYIFLPGKIDWLERIVLSFALSLALVPLTFFWLSRIAGIGLTLLNSSLIIVFLSFIPLMYYLIKKPDLRRNVAHKMGAILSCYRLGKTR